MLFSSYMTCIFNKKSEMLSSSVDVSTRQIVKLLPGLDVEGY